MPLFGGLSKRGLSEIAKIADEIDLAAGKELVREGDPGRKSLWPCRNLDISGRYLLYVMTERT